MKPFLATESIAAPLDMPNVDTDQIIPKQFLKRIERTGFGEFLFWDWRKQADGSDNPDFPLNKPVHKGAQILLTQDNFGCGSSREHAPWALQDYGFQVIIAPSFADIFYNNCFQNGILPITLPREQVRELFDSVAADPGIRFAVDLESQTIRVASKTYSFDIHPKLKEKLLKGLDDIGFTLQFEKEISAFESGYRLFD